MIRFLPVFLAALFLSSCFDSREEVWINADASGAAKIHISLPTLAAKFHGGEAGLRKSLEEYFEATPAFTSYDVATTPNDDQIDIQIACTFANVLDLANLSSQPSMEKLPSNVPQIMGTTKVAFQGLNVDYSRNIDLPKAVPAASFLPKKQLQGHSLTTIIHLPKAASGHNADSATNGGRTLTWNTPLEEALSQPMLTSFTMPLPIPWLTIGVISLLLVILVVALFMFFRSRRRIRLNGLESAAGSGLPQ